MSRLLLPPPAASAESAAKRNALPLAMLEFGSPSEAFIATPIPASSRAINLSVFLLVISVLAASALISTDRIVSASGKLVADSPNIAVQPFDQTIVESIEVRRGDIVHKGQILARLNPTFTAADASAIEDQVDLLSAKTARLLAVTSGTAYAVDPSNAHELLQRSILQQQTNEYNSILQNYDRKIEELESQIEGDLSQATYYRARLSVATDIENMRSNLQERELGSRLNTLLALDAKLNMQGSLSASESSVAKSRSRIAAEQAGRQTFIEQWNRQNSQELADTRGKLVQAQQELAKASLHHELVVLTAPRDAIVLSVADVSVGSVVSSAQPLMLLVPADAPLSVEADISGVESGYISPGDAVTIKFDTLPFLQYGSARGLVRAISPDSFSPEFAGQAVGSVLPNRPHTLYYKGDISLDALMLHNTPPGFRLMPGMPVVAEVNIGKRTVLSYFIDKIVPVAFNSLNEP
ncbi:HlyD family type I secretion periplasmic adaptor subunit [Aestuariivirga sp.]|uniref:HlyD family type I secretion periplasmic adaptor subunit n=1 Tax=Aestuariivirga sp. TaxID=2650926 RepID=UPI003BA99B41